MQDNKDEDDKKALASMTRETLLSDIERESFRKIFRLPKEELLLAGTISDLALLPHHAFSLGASFFPFPPPFFSQNSTFSRILCISVDGKCNPSLRRHTVYIHQFWLFHGTSRGPNIYRCDSLSRSFGHHIC